MTDRNELRRLAEAATPGPWWIDSHGHSCFSHAPGHGGEMVFRVSETMEPARRQENGNLSPWPNDHDATFIAATSPDVVLALLDEIAVKDAWVKANQGTAHDSYRQGAADAREESKEDRDQLRAEVEHQKSWVRQIMADVELLREVLDKIAEFDPAVTHGWAESVRGMARRALKAR